MRVEGHANLHSGLTSAVVLASSISDPHMDESWLCLSVDAIHSTLLIDGGFDVTLIASSCMLCAIHVLWSLSFPTLWMSR
ncbi:hypothetical protein AB1N83_000789 [Pleurotus pulmonarius]